MQLSKSFIDPEAWVWEGISVASNPANLDSGSPNGRFLTRAECAKEIRSGGFTSFVKTGLAGSRQGLYNHHGALPPAKSLPLGSIVDPEGTDRRLLLKARNPTRIGRMQLVYSKYLLLYLSQNYGNWLSNLAT